MIEQGSDEWLAMRAGHVTASRVADVVAKTKSGPSASRAAYMGQLLAERMTGIPVETYTNADMQRGLALEADARAAYEARTGALVQEIDFARHPSIEWAGASPDGVIGESGLVEIKAPRLHTHIAYLLDGKPPSEYVPQMAWQCGCTGRRWVDFVSFDPRMPERLQLFIVRYEPSVAYIAELEAEVRKFLAELEAKLDALHDIERRLAA